MITSSQIQRYARAVPRYPWVPGYRPVPIELLKIWVPMGTGYQPDKKLWVPMGTGYRPDKKLWVPMGTGYRENFHLRRPLVKSLVCRYCLYRQIYHLI